MKRKISRLIKNILIFFRLDGFIASQYHKTQWYLFQKLIPDSTFYKQEDEKTIRRYGVLFKIQPADFMQWALFRDLQDAHVDAALRVLDPSKRTLVLDIGANCGNFSLAFAQLVRSNNWDKQILAFEPNPRIFSRLGHNLNLNPSLKNVVQLVNKGIGERADILELQLPLRNTGAGSLVRNYEHEPHEKYRVEIVSIDDFLTDRDLLPVEFIKIDVENFEFYVLKGAEKTIDRYRPAIYMEMGAGQIRQDDILLFFERNDYALYGEERGRFVLIEERNYKDIERFRNILAIDNLRGDMKASM